MSLDYQRLREEMKKFWEWNGRKTHFSKWLKRNRENGLARKEKRVGIDNWRK